MRGLHAGLLGILAPLLAHKVLCENVIIAGEHRIAFEQAGFGRAADVSGEIVRADPIDASTDLVNAAAVRDRIVVITRGAVSFAVKARRAFSAQARAIIFVNTADEPVAATDPNGEARGIVLPMACIGADDGVKLGDGSVVDLSFDKPRKPDAVPKSDEDGEVDGRQLVQLRTTDELEAFIGRVGGTAVVGWYNKVTHPAIETLNQTAISLGLPTMRLGFAVGTEIRKYLDVRKSADSGMALFRDFDDSGRPATDGAGSQRVDFSSKLYGKLNANTSIIRFIAAESVPPIVPVFIPESYDSPMFRFALLLSTHTRAFVVFAQHDHGPDKSEVLEIGRLLKKEGVVRFHVMFKDNDTMTTEDELHKETKTNLFQLCGITRNDVYTQKRKVRVVIVDAPNAKRYHWPPTKKVNAETMVKFAREYSKYEVVDENAKMAEDFKKKGYKLSDNVNSGDSEKDKGLNAMLKTMKGQGMNFQVWNPGDPIPDWGKDRAETNYDEL